MTREDLKKECLRQAVSLLATFVVAEFREMVGEVFIPKNLEDELENLRAVLDVTLEDIVDPVMKEAMRRLNISKE